MFLGINYNTWHWPLATIAFVITWSIFGSMITALTVTVSLQGLNEFFQALGNVESIYGSEKNFRVNSIQDWIFAFYGIATGFILTALYEGFIK